MQKIYKCELCGEEYDSEKECKEHEDECMSRENLVRRIRELEGKVETLEALLKAKENERLVPYPVYPPQYPTNPPAHPWTNPPIWCETPVDEGTGYGVVYTVSAHNSGDVK